MKSYEYQRASKHWIIANLDEQWRSRLDGRLESIHGEARSQSAWRNQESIRKKAWIDARNVLKVQRVRAW